MILLNMAINQAIKSANQLIEVLQISQVLFVLCHVAEDFIDSSTQWSIRLIAVI